MKQRLQGPPLTRREPLQANAIQDSKTRLVRVSFSSGEPYLRTSFFDDPWVEVLGHDDGEINLSRVNGGAPVLLEHDRDRHIGVVERAWIEGGRGYADLKLSRRTAVDDVWQDIQDGVLRNVSVGYQIHERTLTRSNDSGGPDEYRVTQWTPMEISLVTIPADSTVGIGRNAGELPNFQITDIEVKPMTDKTQDAEVVETETRAETKGRAAPETKAGDTEKMERQAGDTEKMERQAAESERKRISEIMKIANRAGVDSSVYQPLIDDGATIDGARSVILDAMIERGGPEISHQTGHVRIEVQIDAKDKEREAAANWLLFRSSQTIKGDAVDINGNDFRGMTMLDMCRHFLEQSGVKTRGMDSMKIVQRAVAHSTSDFSTVLENTMHKTLLDAYGAVPDTWRAFSNVSSVSDFRAYNRYRTGTFGTLDAVTETNEFKDKTISDAEKHTISASTKGNIISISRQAIINDDMGAFMGLPRMMGRGAARSIEVDWYTLLASNSSAGPAMSDGSNLFDSSNHANVGATGGITPATLDAARQLLANQTDPDGNDYIGLLPFGILVPSGNYAAMTQVLRSEGDPTSGNANSRKYNYARDMVGTVVSTPRISSYWYLFTSPADEPVMEVAFLNGNQSPVLESMEEFRIDGVSYKVRFDYGVAAIGWRGAVRTAVTA